MLVVLHQGAIGDFLLTLSVVGAVREVLGSARVEVIASAASARWAAGKGIVDRWHGPESVGLHTLFASDGPLDPRLSQLLRSATLVLSFLSGPDEAIYERLMGATAGRVLSVDPRPREETLRTRTHITEQWTADIRKQALAIGQPVPAHVAGAARQQQVGRTTHPTDSTRRVIIHPGSGGRHKCWPIENLLALADTLARAGGRVAWMLGPAECDPGDETGEAIRQRVAGTGEELIVEPDLVAAAGWIASYALYIGNDGGMTHLAAATGTPTLAIFTATDPGVWRPLGQNVIVIDARSQSDMIKEVMGKLKPLLIGLEG